MLKYKIRTDQASIVSGKTFRFTPIGFDYANFIIALNASFGGVSSMYAYSGYGEGPYRQYLSPIIELSSTSVSIKLIDESVRLPGFEISNNLPNNLPLFYTISPMMGATNIRVTEVT